MSKTAAYVRVSSRAQTYKTQKDAIERAAHARGMVIDRWYCEKRKADMQGRPELARLRADVMAGRVSTLFSYRLDRLTRSGIRDTCEVVDELRRHGCKLITVADGFDMDGPAAEIILAVMAWSAKMERVAINERISAARERVEAEGRSWGRPRTMTDGSIFRAQAMREEGQSVRSIAQVLGVSRSTLSRTLANC